MAHYCISCCKWMKQQSHRVDIYILSFAFNSPHITIQELVFTYTSFNFLRNILYVYVSYMISIWRFWSSTYPLPYSISHELFTYTSRVEQNSEEFSVGEFFQIIFLTGLPVYLSFYFQAILIYWVCHDILYRHSFTL